MPIFRGRESILQGGGDPLALQSSAFGRRDVDHHLEIRFVAEMLQAACRLGCLPEFGGLYRCAGGAGERLDRGTELDQLRVVHRARPRDQLEPGAQRLHRQRIACMQAAP